MSAESAPLGWVAIDFLCCLLLVVYTLVAPPPTPTSIDTLGEYAIKIVWPPSSDDDVDTYVEDPVGNVVSFSNPDAGLMHLEHDDLGRRSDRLEHGKTVASVAANEERVVLRGVVPGEMVVNVHAYHKVSDRPVPVSVTLYRLRGEDVRLLQRRLVLRRDGEEITVFRFTLDERGRLRGHNRLSKRFLGTGGAQS